MRTRLYAPAALLTALVVAGCGSSATSAGPASASPAIATAPPSVAVVSATLSPPAETPTPTPTAAPSPSPTVVPKTIGDLLAAKHPKVKSGAALAAVEAAYAADPVGPGGPLWTLQDLKRRVDECVHGAAGVSNDSMRSSTCGSLVKGLFVAYQTTGVQADYDAALAVYNYAHASLTPAYVKVMDRYLRE